MVAALFLGVAAVVCGILAWASFEVAGENVHTPEPDGTGPTLYRVAGAVFFILAMICVRSA
jgi:hypothetical protein